MDDIRTNTLTRHADLDKIPNDLLVPANIITDAARPLVLTDQAELKLAIECLPLAIALVDEHNNFTLWNSSFQKMFPDATTPTGPGPSLHSLCTPPFERGRPFVQSDIQAEMAWLRQRQEIFDFGGSIVEENNADQRWTRSHLHRISNGTKILTIADITEERNAIASFQLLFEKNPVPMWVVDKSSQRYLNVNSAALEHYGYTRDEFLKMTLVDLRPPRERQRILDDAKNNFGIDNGKEDWVHLKAEGTEILVSTYSTPIKYENKDAAIVVSIDVTERRKHDAQVQFLVENDSLTGLPNRRFFVELLEGSITKMNRIHRHTALILVDIDDFKGVNDTLGHHVGDSLIVAMANRMKECIDGRGIIARLGGDEFVILLPQLIDPEEALDVATELVDAFKTPLSLPDHEILIGISAGISVGLDDSIDASTLLKHADLALYRAKSDGGGVSRVYEPQMCLQSIVRREMERDLRQALTQGQLEIHYQPLQELASRKEIGFEALLRWNHPAKGMIAPLNFIPIAESSGMIIEIGSWVLDQSCHLATTLKQDLSMAVNVSPVQFKTGNFVETVARALETSGLSPHRLELEITESNLLENSAETMAILKGLKCLGVSIVLDDFGTGYSGLGYLNNYPIDKVKLDRSFIQDIGSSSKSLELIRGIIGIGHGLGMTVLAEGIESAEQLEILRSLGCPQGQGYLFGRAKPADEITDRLRLYEHHVTRPSAS